MFLLRLPVYVLIFYALMGLYHLKSVTYTLYVHSFIRPTIVHSWKMHFIEKLADKNDVVIIDLNTYGGYVTHSMTIVNFIQELDSHTISYNRTKAFSGGAIIAMATKEMKAARYSAYMFHRASQVKYGVKVLTPSSDIVFKLLHEYMVDTVFPYFTEDELVIYIKGDEVGFNPKELFKRTKYQYISKERVANIEKMIDNWDSRKKF